MGIEPYRKYFDASEKVAGWLTHLERDNLYMAAMNAWEPYAQYAELGAFAGKSSIIIGGALAIQGSGTLYSVDPHEGMLSYPQSIKDGGLTGLPVKSQKPTLLEWGKNIHEAGLDLIVQAKVMKSTEWTPNFALDFLFVDALHDEESVMQDWDYYQHRVKTGAIVCWHDYQAWQGVTAVVDMLLRRGIIEKLHQGDSLIVTKYKGKQ